LLLLLLLQVGLDGGLQPLTPSQVSALKQRCGRGGLRVLALAYKDVLLPPAGQPSNGTADASGSNGKGAGSSSGGWQLLDGDEQAGGLVLIGLLGLEDPGAALRQHRALLHVLAAAAGGWVCSTCAALIRSCAAMLGFTGGLLHQAVPTARSGKHAKKPCKERCSTIAWDN
jgi:hypothetical protein